MNSRWKLDILVAMVSRSQTCMNKLRVLSRFHALSPLQTFGIRAFCAVTVRPIRSRTVPASPAL